MSCSTISIQARYKVLYYLVINRDRDITDSLFNIFLFLNISMSNLLEYNFDKFKTSRRISYMFSYFGVASSIVSFGIALLLFIEKFLNIW